ncbi:MAG TPA: hypothetical protein VNJ04_04075 [Gemmatimonadaceae bacterium]|nr:hypothetical protein [Gemmatimonadaceae bacterium]
MRDRKPLFSKFDLHSSLENHGAKLREHVEALPSNAVLGKSPDQLAAEVVKEFYVPAPVLKVDEISVEQQDAKVDVSRDYDRHVFDRSKPFYLSGTRVTFYVPFEGDATLFGARPSTYTTAFPFADINGSEVVFCYDQLDHDAAAVRAGFDRDLAEVSKYLEWIDRDVEEHNATLGQRAKDLVDKRREKLLKDQGLVSALGFPLRRRNDAQRTYVAPEVRRKIPQHARPATQKPFVAEPDLAAAEYDHILSIVDNMVHVMERSPAAFRNMNEESLRQHFLVQLNGQYEGQATGETFNYSGKTDIIIRVKDRNIFVAECKFWTGAKGFTAALNQLLGYATWRDGKLALILFNRTKNHSAVVQQIPALVKAHPNYRRTAKYESGSSAGRYVLHHPSDPDRELVVTILVYDVPA